MRKAHKTTVSPLITSLRYIPPFLLVVPRSPVSQLKVRGLRAAAAFPRPSLPFCPLTPFCQTPIPLALFTDLQADTRFFRVEVLDRWLFFRLVQSSLPHNAFDLNPRFTSRSCFLATGLLAFAVVFCLFLSMDHPLTGLICLSGLFFPPPTLYRPGVCPTRIMYFLGSRCPFFLEPCTLFFFFPQFFQVPLSDPKSQFVFNGSLTSPPDFTRSIEDF